MQVCVADRNEIVVYVTCSFFCTRNCTWANSANGRGEKRTRNFSQIL